MSEGLKNFRYALVSRLTGTGQDVESLDDLPDPPEVMEHEEYSFRVSASDREEADRIARRHVLDCFQTAPKGSRYIQVYSREWMHHKDLVTFEYQVEAPTPFMAAGRADEESYYAAVTAGILDYFSPEQGPPSDFWLSTPKLVNELQIVHSCSSRKKGTSNDGRRDISSTERSG